MHDSLLIGNSENFLKFLNFCANGAIHREDSIRKPELESYGFAKQEDFEFSSNFLINLYRQYGHGNITKDEMISYFSHLNSKDQFNLLRAITQRQYEVQHFLFHQFNSKDYKLLESFDWNIKYIIGNSSLFSLTTQIATIAMSLNTSKEKSYFFFEIDKKKLNKLIDVLTKCQNAIENKNK